MRIPVIGTPRPGQWAKLLFCLSLLATISASAADFPPTAHRLADCENRWFLKEVARPNVRVLGFAYVDPAAGVTIEANGEVAISAAGTLYRKQDASRPGTRLIVRGVSNLEIACLTDGQAQALGLPLVPEWLVHYKDGRAPGPHNVAWASFYNHIGAFDQALQFLRAASDAGYQSAEFCFERGFALNAMSRFKEAVAELESAVKAYPDRINLLAELAYAYLGLREFRRGIELYEAAIAKDGEGKSSRRREFAQKIAYAYSALGDDKSADEWLNTAERWRGGR
jgi:tetratricopeptide (TPR) repeat protein